MRIEFERGRGRPRALEVDIAEPITHQLANAWCAIDMRDDLQEKTRLVHRVHDGVTRDRLVLVAHTAGRDPRRTVVEGAEQGVALHPQRRIGELLGKAPEL